MANDVIPVKIRGILPASSGCALFIGNDEKVFVIQVEQNMGLVIGMALRGTPKDRPLTHDLMGLVFQGFGGAADSVHWEAADGCLGVSQRIAQHDTTSFP